MPRKTSIVIAAAADDSYALPLAVMLTSTLTQLHADTDAELHIVDDGISMENRERVAASLPPGRRAVLHWVKKTDRAEFRDLPQWGRITSTTYHKLTLGEWLPRDIGKVLWLDCDALVLGDLTPLWETDLHGHVVRATPDVVVPKVSSRFGVAAWRELGLSAEAAYFNAGVLLIDLALWRQQSVGPRAHDYLRSHGSRVMFYDQEAFNAVLAGHWGNLDPRWNWNPLLDLFPASTDRNEQPWIVHFSGNLKPWTHPGASRYQADYDAWLDRTEWRGVRPARTWIRRALVAYSQSRWRALVYPLEKFQLRLVRWMTRR